VTVELPFKLYSDSHWARVPLHFRSQRVRVKFQVPLYPGDPPRDLDLCVGVDGRFTALDIAAARHIIPIRVLAGARLPTLSFDVVEDVARLEFQDADTKRSLSFDWPDKAPKWTSHAEFGPDGVLIRVVFEHAAEHLDPELLSRAQTAAQEPS
jgi:hypothetical protein